MPFNPRARYLTGMGDARQARRKRRLLMAAFNPRARYLTGLGDITPPPTDVAPTESLPPAMLQMMRYFQQPTVRPGQPVAGVTPPTAASIADAMNQAASTPAPAPVSWWQQVNPTFGVSNLVLAGGVGALTLLVLLSGKRR